MDEITLKLPRAHVELLMALLTQTPLPFTQSAPVIQAIGKQVQAQSPQET
jgi:hypothetical protein